MNLDKIWYNNHPLTLALLPLSWLFCAAVKIRRQAYKMGLFHCQRVPIPVIVVGNITIGGTGKTPLVIWLGQFLKQHGFRPGIVSRGYGGKAKTWPQRVYHDTDPYLVGDEPILLVRHSSCPVVVAPQRFNAIQMLLAECDCNLIICDDGLQHYALHRDIEIVVIDGIRRHGNRHCLPAGPLREPLSRLKKVGFLITKSTSTLRYKFSMQYKAKILRGLVNEDITQPIEIFRGRRVHAIAGIGYPALFFNKLRDSGLKLYCHEFPDHYRYKKEDVYFNDDLPVIMTEKDAVKCQYFAGPQHWYLPIEAHLPNPFGKRLLNRLQGIIQNGQAIT